MEILEKVQNEIINNWPFKLKLSYKILQIDLPKENEPLSNLLSDFSEIEKLMKLKEDIFKYLYFNYKIIHKILYDTDEIISINLRNSNNFDLSYYFYLSLLITYNTNTVDFKYNINIIKNINEQIIEKNNNIKKILKYKLILDLIENYKQSNEYDEYKDNKILNEIKSNINENIYDEFNLGLNINNCKEINMDKIYINIIQSLIRGKKLENSFNILKKLDFEKITFTKEMIEEILKEDYINEYNILDINDFLNIEKLNFYYILLKYILKNPYYIYQVSFLCKIRIIIIKIIKSNLEKLLSLNMTLNIKEKMEYIIEKITDSKYYFFKYIKYQLEEVLNYYKGVLFESKKADIIEIKNQIKNNNFYNYKKYFTDFNIAQKMNKRIPIILHLLNKNIENDKSIKKTESLLNKYIKSWEEYEEMIKNNHYENMKNEDREIIKNFFIDKKNKKLFLSIFNKDIYNSSLLMNLNLEKDSTTINSSSSKDNSSLNSDISNLSSGRTKYDLIKTINSTAPKFSSLNNSDLFEYTNENKENEIKNVSKYQIFQNFKVINNLEGEYIKKSKEKKNIAIKTIEYIKEINDKYYIIGGINCPINFYDKNLKKIYTFTDIEKKENKPIYSICEVPIYDDNQIKKNKNIFEIIFCCIDKYYLYSFNFEEEKKKNEMKNESKSCLYAIEIPSDNIIKGIKGNDFVFLGEKGVEIIPYLYNKLNDIEIKENKPMIYNKPAYGGILIEKKILAFITKCQKYNKKQLNILILYDFIKKKIIKKEELPFYLSFNLSQNSLTKMNIEKKININKKEYNKVLLCACKKYIKGQKNGILVFNYNFNDKEYIKSEFYKTDNFEVYCFCQLSIYEKTSDLLNDNYEKTNTNYFLVGGYDLCKSKGIIKLYKLIYNYENDSITIKYIEDPIVKDINDIRGPISCIIQSKQNGNILITSWDGNIYSLTGPNKEYISNLEKDEDNNFILSNFFN